MSFLLWLDDKDEQAVDLGNPLLVFQVFAELSRVAPQDSWPAFEELFAVPQRGEQVVPPEQGQTIALQAHRYLRHYGDQISKHSRWILQQLDGLVPAATAAVTPKPAPGGKGGGTSKGSGRSKPRQPKG